MSKCNFDVSLNSSNLNESLQNHDKYRFDNITSRFMNQFLSSNLGNHTFSPMIISRDGFVCLSTLNGTPVRFSTDKNSEATCSTIDVEDIIRTITEEMVLNKHRGNIRYLTSFIKRKVHYAVINDILFIDGESTNQTVVSYVRSLNLDIGLEKDRIRIVVSKYKEPKHIHGRMFFYPSELRGYTDSEVGYITETIIRYFSTITEADIRHNPLRPHKKSKKKTNRDVFLRSRDKP